MLTRARRLLLQKARYVVAPSNWLRDCIIAFANLPRERIRVIRSSTDMRLFDPRKRRESPVPIVGHYKGFEPVYGPETTIDAIPSVLSRCPGTRFEMLGDGALLESCRERARRLGVGDAITWVGRLPYENVPDVVGRWAIAAIPSRKESLCISAVEASALEIPVVASDVGGLPEVVDHGVTGLLVPPDDPPAASSCIRSVL